LAPPLQEQAQAEELTLLVAKRSYHGVNITHPGKPKLKAQVWRGRKQVYLGYFAKAEEAALSRRCVSRVRRRGRRRR